MHLVTEVDILVSPRPRSRVVRKMQQLSERLKGRFPPFCSFIMYFNKVRRRTANIYVTAFAYSQCLTDHVAYSLQLVKQANLGLVRRSRPDLTRPGLTRPTRRRIRNKSPVFYFEADTPHHTVLRCRYNTLMIPSSTPLALVLLFYTCHCHCALFECIEV